MQKQFQQVYLLLVSFILSGCMMNTDYDTENFNSEKQSLVIFRSYYQGEDLHDNKTGIKKLQTRWSSLSKDKRFMANCPPFGVLQNGGREKEIICY